MIVKRTSPFSGKLNEMDIPVTQDQLTAWVGGELIQNAMPNLSADQREFIKTGITPGEWNSLFPANADNN